MDVRVGVQMLRDADEAGAVHRVFGHPPAAQDAPLHPVGEVRDVRLHLVEGDLADVVEGDHHLRVLGYNMVPECAL